MSYPQYNSVAVCSEDGSIQLAGIFRNGVYKSDNTGNTWSQISNGNLPTHKYYSSVAMSSDGEYQIVGTDNHGVYISNTAGSTWIQVSNSNLPTDNSYSSVAMSSDGQYQIVGTDDGNGVYISNTAGSTWTQVSNSNLPTANSYTSVAMSSDGVIQLACTDDPSASVRGKVYKSIDSGATWQIIPSLSAPGNTWYTCVYMSANGTIQVAVPEVEGIWLSSNSGDTWAQSTVQLMNKNFNSGCCSSNGQYHFLGASSSQIIMSSDYGSTWTATGSSYVWTSVSTSSNGSVVLAGTFSNGAYLSTNSGSTWSLTNPLTIPTNTTSPSIAGSAIVGHIITALNGDWNGFPSITYNYQWYKSGSPISGATSSSYTTLEVDIGYEITCDVTATNSVGSSTIDSSNSITVVASPPQPPQPTPPTPSQFTSLSNVLSIAVDSNVEYMYALYVDILAEQAYIAKINANNGTIINSQFVSVNIIFDQPNIDAPVPQIIVVGNDLYMTVGNNHIYKIININTTSPGTSSIWFTSNVNIHHAAALLGLVTYGDHIYTTDARNKCIMQVSLASSGTSSNTPWATLTYNPVFMTINNGYMYVTCGDFDTGVNSYISKINISDPSNPINTWVTIGSYIWAYGLAIYGSYMYVALTVSDNDNRTSSIGLIYLSNGEGILQNPNWVNIPSEFFSSYLPLGITSVIITEKNQNVNLYTCDDIIQIPLYSSPVPPISDICFPAGTPITTDQGIIAIEKINPSIHTINKKPIVDIIRTIYNDKYLIGFKKNAISINCPSQFTVMTKNHKIIWQGRKLEAESFLYRYENVVKVKYSGQILYNVLMEEHSEMVVNNMLCETLDPNNTVAKLYKRTSKYTTSERYKISKFIADSVKNTKFDRHKTYRNIIKKL